MPIIEITVEDKIAKLTSESVIVCGNSDYTIEFTFDSEWDEYDAKTLRIAYFRKGAFLYQDLLFSGNVVTMPALYGINDCAVGVYAGNIHTSTPAHIPCHYCITDGDPYHADPPPDIYNQLLEYIQALSTGVSTIAGDFVFDAAADDVNFADVDITYTPDN